ncbi:MAG: hypothetical protein JKX84_01575 [Flavobacteriales bacterium]|nr:hypothetical protein [Flavobacteriales bacterium]
MKKGVAESVRSETLEGSFSRREAEAQRNTDSRVGAYGNTPVVNGTGLSLTECWRNLNGHEMKNSFRRILKIYKYIGILFSLSFWIYMVIDDYVLWERYWEEHWLQYLGTWLVYYLLYFAWFSVLFWGFAGIVILFYHKIVKKEKTKVD